MESESTSGAQKPRSIHQRGPFIIVLSDLCGRTPVNHSVEFLQYKTGEARAEAGLDLTGGRKGR